MKTQITAQLTVKLKQIRALVMDVDGVLSDGTLWMEADGSWRRAFSILDGLGLKRLMQANYKVGWITGSKAPDIAARAKILGVEFLSEGQEDKRAAFASFLEKYDLKASQVAYIGDDLPDLPLLQACGLAFTVPNAVEEIKAVAEYTTQKGGGFGAVREVCDLLLAP
jgi:3-deoxy-D-manno-octulosonate 8-phosphate phosphatase (KDO 8-P phosphatase)